MAAATILAVEQGWAGDRKRHRVALTLASTNADTVTPQSVGLKQIEAIRPTGAIGAVNIAGEINTTTNHGTGPTFAWSTNTVTVTVETATTVCFYFYGW